MPNPASLWSFEGRWQLAREIVGGGLAAPARLTGSAEFRRSGHRLIYEERGLLELPGHAPIRAHRRYLWAEQNGWIAIRFEDGRPFHGFPLGVDSPEATHLCPPDRYDVRYDFRHWPRWHAHWRVQGPRKGYTLISHFRR